MYKDILNKLYPKSIDKSGEPYINQCNYQKEGQLFFAGRTTGVIPNKSKPLSWETPFRIAYNSSDKVYAYASSRCAGIQDDETSCICVYDPKHDDYTKTIHDLTNYPNHGFDIMPAFSPNRKLLAFLCMKDYGKIGSDGTIMISTFSYEKKKEKVYTLTMTKNLSCSNFLWINDNTILVEYNYKGYSKVCAISFNPNNPSKHNRITHVGNLKLTRFSETGYHYITKSFYFSENKDLSFLNPGGVERCEYITSDNIISYYWFAHPNPETTNGRILLLCQGGPHHAWEPEVEVGTYNLPLLQHLGYTVIMPIVRGMPGINHEFDNKVRGDWGGQCIIDYLYALNAALEKFKIKGKIALMGHSFGGFCSYSMNVQYPEMFCCFVSESGPFNLESLRNYCFEKGSKSDSIRNLTIKSEMFDGLLNPNGEQIADKMIIEQSPHNLLKKNKGKCKPILIIHGKEDKRVPIEQAEEAQKCFGCELLAFDNEGHCITKSENTITRYLKIFKFLDEHMG